VHLNFAELNDLYLLPEQMTQPHVLLDDVSAADGSGGVGLPGVGDVGERGGLVPFSRRRPEPGAAAIAARVRATDSRTSWLIGVKIVASRRHS
jgi:hypothetical protein